MFGANKIIFVFKSKYIPIVLLAFIIIFTLCIFLMRENDNKESSPIDELICSSSKKLENSVKLLCNSLNASMALLSKNENIIETNRNLMHINNGVVLTLQSNDLAGCDRDCQNQRIKLQPFRSSNFSSKDRRFMKSQILLSTSLQCDSECLRFKEYLLVSHSIPAAIYILTHPERITSLVDVLQKLDKHFNNEYKYPVIIFHEEDFLSYRSLLQKKTHSLLFFQTIKFDIPMTVDPKLIPKMDCRKKPIGYRHMCRFHAIQVYREPIILLENLKYVWRLDDDSELLQPILYDPISYMAVHNFKYSYMRILHGSDTCFNGFWETVDEYALTRMAGSNIQFYLKWPKHFVYFNNFEISDLQIWRSQQYQNFVKFIDEKGGIFYYRWGDAEIKTAAVALFLQSDEVFRFWDISYKHVDWMQKQPPFEN